MCIFVGLCVRVWSQHDQHILDRSCPVTSCRVGGAPTRPNQLPLTLSWSNSVIWFEIDCQEQHSLTRIVQAEPGLSSVPARGAVLVNHVHTTDLRFVSSEGPASVAELHIPLGQGRQVVSVCKPASPFYGSLTVHNISGPPNAWSVSQALSA